MRRKVPVVKLFLLKSIKTLQNLEIKQTNNVSKS